MPAIGDRSHARSLRRIPPTQRRFPDNALGALEFPEGKGVGEIDQATACPRPAPLPAQDRPGTRSCAPCCARHKGGGSRDAVEILGPAAGEDDDAPSVKGRRLRVSRREPEGAGRPYQPQLTSSDKAA